jgi:hypothetical protein
MASGINSTFLQVGIATGIAVLGSLFASAMRSHLSSALPAPLTGSAGKIANAVRQGTVKQMLATVPPAARGVVSAALRSSFASGMNELLYVTAGIALVGAVCATQLTGGLTATRLRPPEY